MKKYTITGHRIAIRQCEIVAESEADALYKAEHGGLRRADDSDVYYDHLDILDVEDYDDDELLENRELFLKLLRDYKYRKIGKDVLLSHYEETCAPTVDEIAEMSTLVDKHKDRIGGHNTNGQILRILRRNTVYQDKRDDDEN